MQYDPIDLILMGNLQEAFEAYLDLYLEALDDVDFSIGPDLCTQLLYVASAREEGLGPEDPDIRALVEGAIRARAADRPSELDPRVISDHLEAATLGVQKARVRAERSVERVEREKEMGWRDIERQQD